MAQPHEVRMCQACDDQVGGGANSGRENRIRPRAVAQEGAPLAEWCPSVAPSLTLRYGPGRDPKRSGEFSPGALTWLAAAMSHAPVQADGARV